MLFYLAKPTHGGWVSFSAHLALVTGAPFIYKIGSRVEGKARAFGWSVNYTNVSVDYFAQMKNITILCLEKSHYNLLPVIAQKIKAGHRINLITHDTVEFKKEALDFIKEYNDKINLISIRPTIRDYLEDKYGIHSKYIAHPFYPYERTKREPNQQSIAISRVDFDKHTDVIIEANYKLEKEERIKIIGKINNVYEWQKLNKVVKPEHSPFHSKYPEYMGIMKLDFDFLDGVLAGRKFMVDLSAIHDDGGGTQYTFLEAMYNKIPLVLNGKWSTGQDSDKFKDGYNCWMVNDSNELARLIKISPISGSLVENNKKLIELHTSPALFTEWNKALA